MEQETEPSLALEMLNFYLLGIEERLGGWVGTLRKKWGQSPRGDGTWQWGSYPERSRGAET